MNWNDTVDIGGVPVVLTPEAWAGGVIEYRTDHEFEPCQRGEWGRCTVNPAIGIDVIAKLYTPIFPPRGWAGKTDAELWDAIYGDGPAYIEVSSPHFVCVHFVNCKPPGLISLTTHDMQTCTHHMLGTGTTERMILALQNALTLSRRLGGTR